MVVHQIAHFAASPINHFVKVNRVVNNLAGRIDLHLLSEIQFIRYRIVDSQLQFHGFASIQCFVVLFRNISSVHGYNPVAPFDAGLGSRRIGGHIQDMCHEFRIAHPVQRIVETVTVGGLIDTTCNRSGTFDVRIKISLFSVFS